MELCLITNNPRLALEAQEAGIERIMLDLEIAGKEKRQAGRGLHLSDHQLSDLARVRPVLDSADIMVRINALHSGSRAEVDAAIEAGADAIMLPMWTSAEEVAAFLEMVGGRVKTNALVETQGAVASIDEVLVMAGLNEIHIGLNDLCLSRGTTTIFDALTDGLIGSLAKKICERGIQFGFGGIARLDAELPVSPHRIIGEQIRLGAGRGLLGRSFRKKFEASSAPGEMAVAVQQIRSSIAHWQRCSSTEIEENRKVVAEQVRQWGQSMGGGK